MLSVLVIGSTATAQHQDIWLDVVDGQLVTSLALDFQAGNPRHVFLASFGDSGCAPFTADPGWNSLNGTFTPGTQLGWNALDGLKLWTGDGLDAAGGAFVEFSFFSLSFQVGAGPASGFALNVPEDGSLHVHHDIEMNGAPNGCTPPGGVDPGIYVVNLEVTSTDPDVTATEPFWLVLNYLDQPDADHRAAMQWIAEILACHWDLDHDATIGATDFLALLAQWGTDPLGPPDFDNNGVVDTLDFLDLLAHWGGCP